MEFKGLYTTNEKIEAEKTLPPEKQKEKYKTILSNDAYAVGSVVEDLKNSLRSLIRGMIK